jgi:hypothetical protein
MPVAKGATSPVLPIPSRGYVRFEAVRRSFLENIFQTLKHLRVHSFKLNGNSGIFNPDHNSRDFHIGRTACTRYHEIYFHSGSLCDFFTRLDEDTLESEIHGDSGKRPVRGFDEYLRVELDTGKSPLFHDAILHPACGMGSLNPQCAFKVESSAGYGESPRSCYH